MALYRIAQEALANVVKHARASRAELAVACSTNQAALNVRDDGKGLLARKPPGQATGWGLKNMKERAGLLGGRFSVAALPGKGTQVSVIIPLSARNGSL